MIGRRLALLLLVPLAVAAAGSGGSSDRTTRLPVAADVRLSGRKLDRIERMIERMERTARRWDRWTKCISELPVSEYGDPDHRFGFHYDERDGTGLDLRPALAIDSKAGRRPNLVLFKFSRREGCRSLGTEPTQPGTPGTPGTADPAKLPRAGGCPRRRAWERSSGGSRCSRRGRRAWSAWRSSSTSGSRACPGYR